MPSLLRLCQIIALVLVSLCQHARGSISLIDDLGRTVTLPSVPARIVSLAPSVTETLFALGAGDQIIGVTDFCNYPEETRLKARVGGMVNPNIEVIAALKPDLIVISMEGNIREDFARLTGFGVPVFVTNPRTLNDIRRSIEQLGILTNRVSEATLLTQRFTHRSDSLATLSVVKERRALLFVSLQPLIVAGRNTFLNDMMVRAGAINLAAPTVSTYSVYSRETVITDNPDVILVTSDAVGHVADVDQAYPEWKSLAAVRTHNVFLIDADLISRPGPRAVDGLEALYHIIHFTKGE
jgi:iron complex transport system substrate-binding protein